MTAPDGPSAVLRALRHAEDEPLSGEALSARLGVSRAQIWKHVGALRKRGYSIAGEPGGGYRFESAPDRLFSEEVGYGLATRWLAQKIVYFDETDSTNRVAFDLAREGAPAGTMVIAESQNSGRGRLGRSFYSPPYQNLYASFLLRPDCTIAQAPTLILGAAVAVAETVAEFVGASERVEIKWPNDVLIDRRKTSGILMESSAEGNRIAFAVLGIGINLNVDRETFPAEFRALATSLASETGGPIDRIAFTRTLAANLERALDSHAQGGFEALRPRFEAFFRMTGETIGVEEVSGESTLARAKGIAPTGALEIELLEGPQQGETRRVLAGDVTLSKTRGTRAAAHRAPQSE